MNPTSLFWLSTDPRPPEPALGGKASALATLSAAGFAVPDWFAILPNSAVGAGTSELPVAIVETIARHLPNTNLLAVRSSGSDEDHADQSFAGQFETFLNVTAADVPEHVRKVWESAKSERVVAYRRERGLPPEIHPPCVIVQRMVDARVAGVAFTADPVTGRRGVTIVSAVAGLGDALVSGETDADTWHVERDGSLTVTTAQAGKPCLRDEEVRAVVRLAREVEEFFHRPQDIEWAMEGDRLFLLQARPITSIGGLTDPDGPGIIWDDSNIAESYSGITTPLTFSFARRAYEEVYREFCRILGVSAQRIGDNEHVFRCMIGTHRGRVYYNLLSWYRVLALLPGFQLNRSFMEQMMGVRESLPPDMMEEFSGRVSGRDRWVDAMDCVRTVVGLLRELSRLPQTTARFHARLEAALASKGVCLGTFRIDELVLRYREMERQLLRKWDAPLINDFFAMIFFGVLRKLCLSWVGDADGTIHNDLLGAEGGIRSAEPARRIAELAAIAAQNPNVAEALASSPGVIPRKALSEVPAFLQSLDAYLAEFGDRCLEELKLETPTLRDDPRPLFHAIVETARNPPRAAGVAGVPSAVRVAAEQRVADRLAHSPVKRRIFAWVLGQTRERIRGRENLRFERTRVFGEVRKIFVEIGRRLADQRRIHHPRDVFYLSLDEILSLADASMMLPDLGDLVRVRRELGAHWKSLPAPPSRFRTSGAATLSARIETMAAETAIEGDLRGTGCYPGVVRARVRVVTDPRNARIEPGEILVAPRTDPGWILLFPSAAGLLVQHGSLLSHSAIIARELCIPAIVSIPGLLQTLGDGELVEMDGRTGTVRRLESPSPSPA